MRSDSSGESPTEKCAGLAEVWKPIPSAPDYLASHLGRIKRARVVEGSHGRPLRQTGSPYLAVAISINGKERTRRVHALVCEAFHGPAPMKHEVRHLDGNRKNNHADNLCWGTRIQNHADKKLHGTQRFGARMYQAILTDRRVLEARTRIANGERYATIAQEFGVHKETLRDAVLGRTWKHLMPAGHVEAIRAFLGIDAEQQRAAV